ncbi:hypothetical protein [Pseudoalteromonas umbrosa]|uniref:hypothetical protein n=1 Tax=Pseudoalteromonas umbrosa TaxID=3048489 RepID=UPI0024C292ED|nr:hypothetical protein [Pseudoalteromonas sp. B95]MDK1286269.1 hypothetical protein [Pseudoalteromonas sp. B95]
MQINSEYLSKIKKRIKHNPRLYISSGGNISSTIEVFSMLSLGAVMVVLTKIGKELIVVGVFFLVSLIQGALIPIVKNSTIALSGYLTAVQCAIALAILGIIRLLVELPLLLEVFAVYDYVWYLYLFG